MGSYLKIKNFGEIKKYSRKKGTDRKTEKREKFGRITDKPGYKN